MAAKSDKRTTEKARFLQELRNRGSVYHAAHAAGVGRSTVYEWREADEAFAAKWDEAVEDSTDELERSLYERAVYGVEEPVFHKGFECGRVRKYSDTAAIFLLKGRRPETYRERADVKVEGDLGFAEILKAARERSGRG